MTDGQSNEQIVSEIRNRGDPDGLLRLELLQRNQGFIRGMWRPYSGIIPESDLEGIGFIAVDVACRFYNPDSGAGFLKSLSWALLRELSFAATDLISGIHLTRSLQTDLRQYSKIIRDYYSIHHEEPEDGHILATMGIDEERLEEIRTAYTARIPKSLDQPIATDDEGTEVTLSDTLASDADVSEMVTQKCYADSLSELLFFILGSLPQQQKSVIQSHYFSGKTLRTISDETGMPQREVRRLETTAIKTMRRDSRLQSFFDEENLYLRSGLQRFRVTSESSTEHTAIELYFRKGGKP